MNESIRSVLSRIIFAACVYFIWNERNKRLFTNDKHDSKELINIVINHIRLKLSSLKVKRSIPVMKVCNNWDVIMNGKLD